MQRVAVDCCITITVIDTAGTETSGSGFGPEGAYIIYTKYILTRQASTTKKVVFFV